MKVDWFARLALATSRALILVLAVVMLVDYMIAHPNKTERSIPSIVLPLALLVAREGMRWDK